MQWQDWSREFEAVLGLEKPPVGVAYVDVLPEGATGPKCRACSALHRAAAGEMIAMNAENSLCPGGGLYLGFRTQTPEQAAKLRNFLINGEKLFSCPAAVYRMRELAVAPPVGMAQHVLFAPLSRLPVQPDVAVIACNAWQASRLVGLAWYETGEPMQCDPTGALCRSAVTYPLVNNRVNVTFGDVTARKSEQVPESELYVTLPWVHLRSVVASLSGSSAGTAAVDMSQVPRGE